MRDNGQQSQLITDEIKRLEKVITRKNTAIKMRDLKETIAILRYRSAQHLRASMQVDPCRILGFYACSDLANKLEHIHKMETQENIAGMHAFVFHK